jgi:polyisoprenoid-binding protein YceI
MRFELSPDSRVFIDLRATGLLRAVGHDPTLSARPAPATLDLDDGQVTLRFPVADIEPQGDIGESDRNRMMDNMRSAEVLDATRFPVIELRGRYEGTADGGALRGELVVRGQPHRLAVTLRATKQWDVVVATGTWEGKLTDLGIKPFKALLGALKLEDWIRLRVEARLRIPSTP